MSQRRARGRPRPCAGFLRAATVLVLTFGRIHAEETPGLHFERIGAEGGPLPAVITALHQDRSGFIWIGSRNGLTLFDGHGYVTFQNDPSDPGSLSDNSIRTIYEDSDGSLWLGTNARGLNRFDPATRSFVSYRHDSANRRSLSHDSVYAILEDRSGRLWVGTQKGLNRFDAETGTFERMLADPVGSFGLESDYILALHEDSGGQLWVGTLGGGLHRWNEERSRFDVFRHDAADPASLVDDSVSAILEDDAGWLWVGTLKGLDRLSPGRDRFVHATRSAEGSEALRDAVITTLAKEMPGRLWAGTHGDGLFELDTATGRARNWRHDSGVRDSLSEDKVIALLPDRAGALWIGTWGGGLNRLSSAAQRFGGPGGIGRALAQVPDPDVTSLMNDRHGAIWLGTRTGFLVRVDPRRGRPEVLLSGGGEGSSSLLDLEEDRQGRIWLGTSAGLSRLDPETGRLESWSNDPNDPRSLGPGHVGAVLEDSRGRVWVGTGEGGLQRFDPRGSVVRRFMHDPDDPNSLSDNYVTSLLEGLDGTLWVGTRSGGLNLLDPESGRARRFLSDPADPESIGHDSVTSLLQDSTGRIWVGTSGGGLNLAEVAGDGRVRFDRVTEADGLVDDDVTGIVEDDDGSLWISTRSGLSRYHPGMEAFVNLFVSDGLPSAEFEGGSVARGREWLCFGSVRGLVALPAGTDFERPDASPVVVRSIRTAEGDATGRRPPWALDRLELPYGTWFSIELAVLDFSPELAHRYAYRLEDDWVEIGSRREITFTALDPGTHAFRARGRNSQGVWAESSVPLLIHVVPPFWMTNGFRLLVLMGVAALAFGAHWRRTSVLERRNRELEELHRQREKARQDLDDAYQRLRRLTRRLEAAKEDERKRIARELHDEMGPSLTAVIINLQLLTTQTEPEKVARKISDTVDLVDRMVQRVRDISLDLRPPLIDELGLVPALSGYLESLSERSGLQIYVRGDDELGSLPAEVPITAFRVVQEAVTNVMRHAAASRVDVSVRRNGQRLQLEVEDDGRGFDVRETMERAAAGRALGLLGMQERVDMLDGEIEIDSRPGDGTRIRVRLPLEVTA